MVLLNGPQSVRISHMHNNGVRNCLCIYQRVTGKIVPCLFCGLQVTRTHDIFRIVPQRTENLKIKDLIIQYVTIAFVFCTICRNGL